MKNSSFACSWISYQK
ncbi:hypothetical protein [Shimazuella soli]